MHRLPVELTSTDKAVLRGERWGNGPDWLVLLHDLGRDLDCWRAVEELVETREDWSALALDLRGHGGSDDPWNADRALEDVVIAVRYARSQGATSVCAVGAGAGAILALAACAEPEPPEALVLLSPTPLDGFDVEHLRGSGVSKLFFVGAQGRSAAETTARLRAASIGQSLVVSFPTSQQGTELLDGEWAVQALEHLAAFFDEQRSLACSPAASERKPAPAAIFQPTESA